MLTYYFYNNIKKNIVKTSSHVYLLAVVFELNNIVLNLYYINKFFVNMFTLKQFKINTKSPLNISIFFYKIRFLIKTMKKFFKINRKINSWKLLIMSFFIALSSVVVSSSFLYFNLNVDLNVFNFKNYYYKNIYTVFKVSRIPGRFGVFYFYLHIYKIFLSSKFSMFLPKFLILINFEFILFFKLVKIKKHINYKFKNLIYI